MEIKQKIISEGRPNRPARALNVAKITIHNTANTRKGANAKAHAKYLLSTDDKVSWHFTCDDSDIYQHLPINEIGYHAKSGNSNSIGIEICENEGIQQDVATDIAAKLCAKLLKKHNLKIDDTVTHNYWTGKICPRKLLNHDIEGQKWKNFKSDVNTYYELEEEAELKGLVVFKKLMLPSTTLEDDLIDLDHQSITIG